MAELADATDSKPVEETREGSTPSPGTTSKTAKHYFQGTESLPETMDMLPEQFHEREEDHRTSGERGLMLAVVDEAVAEFQKLAFTNCPHEMYERAALDEWFRDRSPSDWPFTYLNICTELDIDPERICNALFAWRSMQPVRRDTPFVRKKCHAKEKESHGRQHASGRSSTCHPGEASER